ncbi:HD domain-containing protein [bacterium]|nr:HD domain-containing protein [bacterium]
MGIDLSSLYNFRVGSTPKININSYGSRVTFGNSQTDSFQINSPARLFNEVEIKNMIATSPEVKKILSENKISGNLNMAELHALQNGHCKDTQDVAVAIANYLPPALKQQVNIRDLKDGALLHDFGKVLIPAEILNKNGRLTDDEHKIMDLHTELGYYLLKNSGLNDSVLNMVRYHHDNYLKTETGKNFVPDINLQILNIADKYSALTEKRVYKDAYDSKKALMVIYGDVQRGEVHPFLFNALVKAVSAEQVPVIVK